MTDRRLATLLALAEQRPVSPRDGVLVRELQSDHALARSLARQQRVVEALQTGGPAPSESLATRLVDAAGSRTLGRRPFPRTASRSLPLTAAATAAAAMAVIVIALQPAGGDRSLPTATQISAVWTRPGTGAPVAAAPGTPALLDVSYRGVAFPNYHDAEGWHPIGVRRDRIGGALTVTVVYVTGARRGAYTVVPGANVEIPAGATPLRVAGLRLHEFRSGDRWIVTFEREGSTCILTAAAPREKAWLLKLAAWHSGPALAER